jgi:hypothetical protein
MTLSKRALPLIMLSVVKLSERLSHLMYCCAKCRYAECRGAIPVSWWNQRAYTAQYINCQLYMFLIKRCSLNLFNAGPVIQSNLYVLKGCFPFHYNSTCYVFLPIKKPWHFKTQKDQKFIK